MFCCLRKFSLEAKTAGQEVQRVDVGVVFAANSQGFYKLVDTFECWD